MAALNLLRKAAEAVSAIHDESIGQLHWGDGRGLTNECSVG